MNAAQLRAEAAQRLMDKKLAEDWSESREAELNDWLSQSLAHQTAYWRLEAAWDQTDRLAALRRPPLARMRENTGPRSIGESITRTRKQRNWTGFARLAAAALIIAVLGGAALFYAGEPTTRTYATETGGRQIITLPDGTQIELNTESTVRVATSGAERKVWLDRGEAYFHVRHGEKHPFTVIAGGNRIVDLGTKFVVHRQEFGHQGQGLSVAVTEGSVELRPDNAQKATKLIAGQIALLTPTRLAVETRPLEELTAGLTWRSGMVTFNYTTLAEAAKEFNRYNRNKLVIADPQTAKRTVVGTFSTNDVDAFVRLTQRLFGLSVKTENNQTILSR